MDPLSVSASVVGLLTAGAQISSFLIGVARSARDAPKLAETLLWEMADISAALGSLQAFVSGRTEPAAERGALILLEHVLTTLTGCVTTYSDLKAIVDQLNINPDMGTFDKLKWARQESQIAVIVQRLQNHKSSLTLMLSILQCQSMQEAEMSTRRLCAVVEELLQSNRDLAERINGLERVGSTVTETATEIDDISTIKLRRVSSMQPVSKTSFDDAEQLALKFTFEKDLMASRAYNQATENRQSLMSVTSSAMYTTALSVFSRLSLSQVSNISFYALPVYASDLTNSSCYVFGEEGAAKNAAEKASRPPSPPPLYGLDLAVPYSFTWRHLSTLETGSANEWAPLPNRLGARIIQPRASGLLGRFARRRMPRITGPENPIHVMHVGFDPVTNDYLGLPRAWKSVMNGEDLETEGAPVIPERTPEIFELEFPDFSN